MIDCIEPEHIEEEDELHIAYISCDDLHGDIYSVECKE